MEQAGGVRADRCPQRIPQVLPARAINEQVFNGFGDGVVAQRAMILMVGGKGGDGGEAADRGEGAYAELHHERYGREKMRGEGGAMLAEWVGSVVVGLVTCQGGRGRAEARFPSIPN